MFRLLGCDTWLSPPGGFFGIMPTCTPTPGYISTLIYSISADCGMAVFPPGTDGPSNSGRNRSGNVSRNSIIGEKMTTATLTPVSELRGELIAIQTKLSAEKERERQLDRARLEAGLPRDDRQSPAWEEFPLLDGKVIAEQIRLSQDKQRRIQAEVDAKSKEVGNAQRELRQAVADRRFPEHVELAKEMASALEGVELLMQRARSLTAEVAEESGGDPHAVLSGWAPLAHYQMTDAIKKWRNDCGRVAATKVKGKRHATKT